jgi:hypothetical protein
MNKRHLFYHVLLPLFCGILLYWAARPSVLAFKFCPNLQPLLLVKYLPVWVVYNLPDGLWSYSFMSFTLILWQNNRSIYAYFWLILAFSLGILLEIGQYFHILSGTFDGLDILVYGLFNLLSIVQLKSKNV